MKKYLIVFVLLFGWVTIVSATCLEFAGPLELGAGEGPVQQAAVLKLQNYLKADLGLTDFIPDGFFSRRTRTYLIAFQQKYRLVSTGKLDQATIDLIKKTTCSEPGSDRAGQLAKALAANIMNSYPPVASGRDVDYTRALAVIGVEAAATRFGLVGTDNYLQRYADAITDKNGKILSNSSSVDANNVLKGMILLSVYEKTHNGRYLKGAKNLAEQKVFQSRHLSDGGMVHAGGDQLWADTLYMVGPFLGRLGKATGDQKYFAEGAKQFIVHADHLQDSATGLFHHAWDQSSGIIPAYWGRANGWAIMGLVTFLEYLPENYPDRPALLSILNKQAEALAKNQNSAGLWYQILDRPTEKKNWTETSGSSMFTYALARAVHKGFLAASYQTTAEKGWKGLETKAILRGSKVTVKDIVIGTTASSNLNDYYTNKKKDNDPHGLGSFLLAATEMAK
ncbi:MAG: glycoside hydrolase family 88 protein [Candidatus Vogelbacteria bacterium]|nr:glycoside hydrolase family 88 protein [Candidatus Vogelbacteria bacterium]